MLFFTLSSLLCWFVFSDANQRRHASCTISASRRSASVDGCFDACHFASTEIASYPYGILRISLRNAVSPMLTLSSIASRSSSSAPPSGEVIDESDRISSWYSACAFPLVE